MHIPLTFQLTQLIQPKGFSIMPQFDYFAKDNFAQRRSSGCLYDPESLITGAEVAEGLEYGDRREWPTESHYLRATGADPGNPVHGSWIPVIGPRVRRSESGVIKRVSPETSESNPAACYFYLGELL